MGVIGIRREDKSEWELRTPLVPEDVARLVAGGVTIHVESSPNRCFPDEEFAAAGAQVVSELEEASVILGVKEVPLDKIAHGKSYLFFSHTIKGQPQNMPMLRRLMETGCTLLDYELVTNSSGVRTIAFGRFAGLAGAIDTLWALGQRFETEGTATPLSTIRQARHYRDADEACAAVRDAGRAIAERGLPASASPLVIAVTGEGGKVWGGALEILELLPHRRVTPAELPDWVAATSGPAAEVAIVSYGPGHLVEAVDPAREYRWEDYLRHPERYRARFGRDLQHLTAIIHGIFWKDGYPRFILRDDVSPLWAGGGSPRLRVVTDVTCDLEGSNELLVQLTDPGDPAYVVDPDTWTITPGFRGRGPVVVAVDILPTELPRDASRLFSHALVEFIPHLAEDDPFPSIDDSRIPGPLRRSLILLRGKLTAPWDERLEQPLAEHAGRPEEAA